MGGRTTAGEFSPSAPHELGALLDGQGSNRKQRLTAFTDSLREVLVGMVREYDRRMGHVDL